MRPRWRKVLSDLWDNKFRTILVVASIAVGVFSVGTIAGAYVIISQDISASYASANPDNIEIWTAPFDNDLLTSIEKVPGVRQAEGRLCQVEHIGMFNAVKFLINRNIRQPIVRTKINNLDACFEHLRHKSHRYLMRQAAQRHIRQLS